MANKERGEVIMHPHVRINLPDRKGGLAKRERRRRFKLIERHFPRGGGAEWEARVDPRTHLLVLAKGEQLVSL